MRSLVIYERMTLMQPTSCHGQISLVWQSPGVCDGTIGEECCRHENLRHRRNR
jgi:hypothetical protein